MFVEVEGPIALAAGRARAGARPARRAVSRRQLLGRVQPYLYVLPALLSIAVWIYWPLAGTIELSFFQWNLVPTTPRVPVGLENYRRVLTLPEMGQALTNTLLYVAGLIPFSVILPLAIALLVADLTGRMRSAYRVIIFAPVLMAPVVVAVVWRWILHPSQGIFNDWLMALGLDPVNVFRDKDLAIWAIIFITGWKHLGFSVLLFSAGLTSINREYMEAARMDGAGRWQVIRHITLPLLSPTIMFTLLLTILLSAQWTFPLINVLTQGGPLDSTTNIYYILWEFGFRNFNIGFSSAAAVLFFVAFGALALLFIRMLDRYSFYDD